MAKAKTTAFFCKECGYESAKWMGQCPACKQWNTLVEVPETLSKKYFKGKDQKSIEDIMEKALAAWFAAEGGADVW